MAPRASGVTARATNDPAGTTQDNEGTSPSRTCSSSTPDPDPPVLSADQRRDPALLGALRATLDHPTSNAMATAFANSTGFSGRSIDLNGFMSR